MFRSISAKRWGQRSLPEIGRACLASRHAVETERCSLPGQNSKAPSSRQTLRRKVKTFRQLRRSAVGEEAGRAQRHRSPSCFTSCQSRSVDDSHYLWRAQRLTNTDRTSGAGRRAPAWSDSRGAWVPQGATQESLFL